MARNILDDLNWENEEPEEANDEPTKASGNVIMLKTFNTEEEAQVCAAALKSEGIEAHIISSATGGMTPFAYGNIRLFVAEYYEEDALKIIQHLEAKEQILDDPKSSAVYILVLILIGLFVTSILMYSIQYVLK